MEKTTVYYCNVCQKSFKNVKEKIQQDVSGGFRVRGDCPKCGRYLQWVPYAVSIEVKKAISEYFNRQKPEVPID